MSPTPNSAAPDHTNPEDTIDRDAARALCRSLAATAETLMDVIDSETALLRDGHHKAIETLQSDKIELSARYLTEMTRLKRHADIIRGMALAEIETLKPLMQAMGAKLLENRDALADVLSVSERLIRTATMAAIASRDAPTTYGSTGMATPPPNGTAAISVNRAL